MTSNQKGSFPFYHRIQFYFSIFHPYSIASANCEAIARTFSPHEKKHAPHCFTDLLNTDVDNGFWGFLLHSNDKSEENCTHERKELS